MFTPQEYRTKAAEYTTLAKTTSSPAEAREFQALEKSFTVLADTSNGLPTIMTRSCVRVPKMTPLLMMKLCLRKRNMSCDV